MGGCRRVGPETRGRSLPAHARSAILILASLGWSLGAGAQPESEENQLIDQLDLNTLLNTPVDVWTPTRAPQRSYEAPSIVTTVTREQFSIWGYRTLAELLAHLLGFYVVDDHTTPNVAVRGNTGGLYADSSVIKVLIDGHPIAFLPTGGTPLGPELIPLSAVDRIEVIRGPASALYGAGAFLGMINIRTRTPDAIGAEATTAVGRVGKRVASDLDLAVTGKRGMVDGLLALRLTRQDLSGLELPASSPAPRLPRYNRDARTAIGLEQSSDSAVATLALRPRAGRVLRLFGHYSAISRGSEFGSLVQLAHGFDRLNTFSENRVSLWQLRAGLQGNERLARDLELEVRAAAFRGGTRDNNRLEVGSEFFYVRPQLQFRGIDAEADLRWAPGTHFTVTGGTSLLIDDEQLPSRITVAKQATAGVQPGEVISAASIFQERKTFLNTGAYVQGTGRAWEGRIGLTAGLRYDRHNIYGDQLSHRVGLVGSPRPDLHAKLLHGRAFSAPSPFLMYAVPATTGDVVGNPGLRPQYVNTYEAQIEWTPGPVRLSTDVAYNVLDDKTEFIQTGLNRVARNVARTATLSSESEATLMVSEWLNGRLSFEWQHTVLTTGQEGYARQVIGTQGTIYPRVMVHAGLAVQGPRWPLRLAVQSSYIGTRRASETNILLNRGSYTLPPYFLLEANLATRGIRLLRRPGPEVALSLSGKNLLGADGPTPGFSGVDYPLAPRGFFLQVNLTL
jgi:iron complex outermembrane receptor protein